MHAEEGFRLKIEKVVLKRLGRKLTAGEKDVVFRSRSLLGYEAILDYVSDESLSESEIENYLSKIV